MSGKLIELIEVASINQPMLRAYADASGDHNSIHQDEAAAKAVGLPGVIAHGMLIAGLIGERGCNWLRSHLPEGTYERDWRPSGVQTRFRAMTFLGDAVSVGGRVKSETESSITLELQAKNQKGDILTTASLSFTRR